MICGIGPPVVCEEAAVTNLKTDPSLLRALEESARQKPTAHELQHQRISFIMGAMKDNSSVTREQIRKILAEHEGKQRT